MTRKAFRILSIDGGGIRGTYSAYILKCIEERLGIDIYEKIDMFAGTSTGAIICGALALNNPELKGRDIFNFYKNEGPSIFKRKFFFFPKVKLKNTLQSFYHSVYNSKYLDSVLSREFGEVRLGDIEKALIITATDIGNGQPHILRSNYPRHYKGTYKPISYRDAQVALKDAVIASCAAPTFFDPHRVNPYLLADGGMWANNPALCAIMEAQKSMQKDLQDIRVLSIGTGATNTRNIYDPVPRKRWGLMTGWGFLDFLKFFFALQSNSDMHYLNLLLNPHQITRVNYVHDRVLTLDVTGKMKDYISKADESFTRNAEEIWEFFDS